MASNATESGQAFQGFIVPESGLSFEYSGTTANLEWSAPSVASGTADGFMPIPSGTPDVSAGNELYLWPVRGGAPGPDGCGYMWTEAASYSAALSAGLWRGWDAPTMLRYTYRLDGTGSQQGACLAVKSDGTALAFWGRTDGSAVTLRYATFDGSAWTVSSTAIDTRTTTGGYSGTYYPAAVVLPDDSVVIFYLTSDVTDSVQVTMLTTGGIGATRVLPSALSVPYGVTGMRAAYSRGQIVLFITQLDVSSSPTVSQYASGDGGQSFTLVETWSASRHLVAVTATPTGFVALLDREVSAGSWRPEVRRIGNAYSPLSTASLTALFDGDRASSGPDKAMLLAYDPVGALHIFRQAADPTADAPNQAVSLDGGASWKSYGGGLRSEVGNRGWYAGRVERILGAGHAAWCGDRMLAVVTDNNADNTSVLHYGGAAMRPMPAGCWDQGESAPTYIGRMVWSLSYLPLGDEPPGDVGWTTTDGGTVTRTFGAGAGGGPALNEAFDATETTEHRYTFDNDGAEVVTRAVITGTGDAEPRVRALSGDGADYVAIEVRYDTGSGVWSWRDVGAGSWTTLGTSDASSTPHEVIVAASKLSGKGYALVRKWADSRTFDGANLYTVAATTLTSVASASNSGGYYIVSDVSLSSTVSLYALDTAITSLTAAFTADPSLPTLAGRPLSSEVATYLGAGLSLQATDTVMRGSSILSYSAASSTGAPNLDPVSVPTPLRYFRSAASPGYTKTITITRDSSGTGAGWTSELMGLHLEGIEGWRSVLVELYDSAATTWRTLGTYDAATTGLYWARKGTTFRPRESGSAAGTSLWLDRNELINGAWEWTGGAFPVAENSSGTWVDGSTVAESRPFVRADPNGDPDAFIGAASTGTDGVIRWPAMTILFQPTVLGDFADGCTQVRLTIATSSDVYEQNSAHILRKIAFGPVVVMPRELTRAQPLTEEPRVERISYPDGAITVTRRGPRSSRLELAYSHSHAPERYDRWSAAATAPNYLKASGTGARPLATAEDVVGVLRGLWDDASDGSKPLVWVPYIASGSSSWTYLGRGAGVYGLVSGAYQRRGVVGRPNYSAESTVEAFTFERLTWERE